MSAGVFEEEREGCADADVFIDSVQMVLFSVS